MFRYLMAMGSVAMLVLLADTNTKIYAQVSISQDAQQSAVVTEIQTSIVRAIGAQDKTVEVSVSDKFLTVARANSNINQATHGGRDNEAIAIASIVSKAIADKPEFKNIIAIRVQYLIREGSVDSKVIDTVEFRKDQNGVFQHHRT